MALARPPARPSSGRRSGSDGAPRRGGLPPLAWPPAPGGPPRHRRRAPTPGGGSGRPDRARPPRRPTAPGSWRPPGRPPLPPPAATLPNPRTGRPPGSRRCKRSPPKPATTAPRPARPRCSGPARPTLVRAPLQEAAGVSGLRRSQQRQRLGPLARGEPVQPVHRRGQEFLHVDGNLGQADDVLVGLDEAVGGIASLRVEHGAHDREGDREPVGEPGRGLVCPQSPHQPQPPPAPPSPQHALAERPGPSAARGPCATATPPLAPARPPAPPESRRAPG